MLGEEPFVVLNGDIFTDFPFAALDPIPDWADVHLVVTPRPAFREQGDFEVHGNRVTARGNRYVYCGIGVLRPSLFAAHARHSKPAPHSLRDYLFRAIDAGRISAQIWTGAWTDIGSREQLDRVNGRSSGNECSSGSGR